MFGISRAKSGKLKSQKAPSLLGKQKAVGQYWLIKKRTGTNYVNFVVNLVMYGKVFDFPKNFVCPENFFEPLKWYTDRNFFGDGGGEPKEMCSTKNYFGTSRAQSKKVGQIYFRPPNFFLPVRP
jgi:hypothetical protein